MKKNAVPEAGLLLEAASRKIRRHNGQLGLLEFQILPLHVERALSLLPNPPRPDINGTDSSARDGANREAS